MHYVSHVALVASWQKKPEDHSVFGNGLVPSLLPRPLLGIGSCMTSPQRMRTKLECSATEMIAGVVVKAQCSGVASFIMSYRTLY
jgi:hypothetical protein